MFPQNGQQNGMMPQAVPQAQPQQVQQPVAAGQNGQYFTVTPQQQPVPAQQQQPPVQQQPNLNLPQQPQLQPFPTVLPNLNLPQQPPPPPPAPASPTPQADPFQTIYQALAPQLGTTAEGVAQLIGNDPNKLAAIVGHGFQAWQRDRTQAATPPAQQPQPQQGQQQPGQPQEYTLPPNWGNFVRFNQERGVYEPVAPDYAQVAAMANHNQAIRQGRIIKFGENPLSIFEDPKISEYFQQMVQTGISKALHDQNLTSTRNNFLSKNGQHLFALDNMGNKLLDVRGNAVLTPLGIAFNHAAKQLVDSGMQENEMFYTLAMDMAQKQVGPIQPQQQPTQQTGFQQTQPQGTNGFFQPSPGQPPGQSQPTQPSYNPVQQALALNNGQNRLIPGNSPQRAAIFQRPGSIRELVTAATADMPDGLSMDHYLNRILPVSR